MKGERVSQAVLQNLPELPLANSACAARSTPCWRTPFFFSSEPILRVTASVPLEQFVESRLISGASLHPTPTRPGGRGFADAPASSWRGRRAACAVAVAEIDYRVSLRVRGDERRQLLRVLHVGEVLQLGRIGVRIEVGEGVGADASPAIIYGLMAAKRHQ